MLLGRRARTARVLKGAGLKLFVWREDAIPTPAAAREQITLITGVPEPTPASAAAGTPKAAPTAGWHDQWQDPGTRDPGRVELDDEPRREPPPSTWFDDLDSGPMPLDPVRKRRPGA